jgi:hypothetical protein
LFATASTHVDANASLHATAEVFNSSNCDVTVGYVNVGIRAKALTNSSTEFARDCGGRLSINSTKGGQSSQGNRLKVLKKAENQRISPFKTLMNLPKSVVFRELYKKNRI